MSNWIHASFHLFIKKRQSFHVNKLLSNVLTSCPNCGFSCDLFIPLVSIKWTEVRTQNRDLLANEIKDRRGIPYPMIKTHPLWRKAHCSDFKRYSLCLIWIPRFSCYDENVPILFQAKKNWGLSGAARPRLATGAMPQSRAAMVAAVDMGSGWDPSRLRHVTAS